MIIREYREQVIQYYVVDKPTWDKIPIELCSLRNSERDTSKFLLGNDREFKFLSNLLGEHNVGISDYYTITYE